ncbi:MAG TPA: orotate phosphoribosyltransferase, partial [Flavobacteriaceae bacterium]|nr:orotate phosphoribosyltransferase [Flavobacteriaceae bacterium]
LKGMPEIALEVKEVNPPNKVVLGAISDKLPFTLTANVEPVDETTSQAELLFEGEFNSMMAMMIKSPISKFLETLTTNMEKL